MTKKSGHAHVWTLLLEKLNAGIPSALLIVAESEGSSPGRQGFKMAVSLDGDMAGSIGGGIMEHKLVELTRSNLEKGTDKVFFTKQIHKAESLKDRSGMICSGEQTVIICPLPESLKLVVNELIRALNNRSGGILSVTNAGFSFDKAGKISKHFEVNTGSEKEWSYREQVKTAEVVHIIGAGHVGKSLSMQMAFLGFYVKLYDNRPSLNTLETNDFANEKIVVSYDRIGELIPSDKQAYVVVMTFGYREDKQVLKQLLDKTYRYLGMMGSEAKVEQLMAELVDEGYDKEALNRVKAPIGFRISSKTPEEIAVSIAAEIVKIKNKV